MSIPPQTPANQSQSQRSNAENASTRNDRDVPEWMKTRVRKVDKTKERCIVENSDRARAIDFAHVCAKQDADEDLMTSLDWYWNTSKEKVNFDSRYNVMLAGAALHRLFDRHDWVLVPEESVVKRYHDKVRQTENEPWVTRREDFPKIPDDTFKYRLIPIVDIRMRKIAIMRQTHHPSDSDSLMAHHFTIHTHPFATLPELTSHVHPRFVILKAGIAIADFYAKLRVTENYLYNRLLNRYPILRDIVHIYGAWTAEVPRRAAQDQTYNVPSKKAGTGTDSGSSRTGKRSAPSRKRSRMGPPEPETPTPAPQGQQPKASSSKGKGKQAAAGYALSEKSLELHDKEVGQSEDCQWTNDAIQTWSDGCRPLPTTAHIPWRQFSTGICV